MFRFAVLLLVAASMVSAEQPGVALFSGFLAANPEIQAQFPKFANVPAADLASNADFVSHAGKIAALLDGVATRTNWDDVDALSVFHKGIGQVNTAYFNAFRTYAAANGVDAAGVDAFIARLVGSF
jgi:hypothetical protein